MGRMRSVVMGRIRSIFRTRPGRRRPLTPVDDRVALRRLQDELGSLQDELTQLQWELEALATQSHGTTLAEPRSHPSASMPQPVPDTLTAAQLWEIADRLDRRRAIADRLEELAQDWRARAEHWPRPARVPVVPPAPPEAR